MKRLRKAVAGVRAGIDAYKGAREEALEVIESEAGRGSWALRPVIKEIHTLPYITLKWLGGFKV